MPAAGIGHREDLVGTSLKPGSLYRSTTWRAVRIEPSASILHR